MEASRLTELIDKIAEHHACGLNPMEILPYLSDEQRDLATLVEAVTWLIQQHDPNEDLAAKLPHTHDGVAVVPFVDWVWSPKHHDLVGRRPISFEVNKPIHGPKNLKRCAILLGCLS